MKNDIVIEKFVRNVLFTYSKSTNFTSSDVIHTMKADHTGLPPAIAAKCREFAANKTVLDHGSGKSQIIYVKDKGNYGRTNRPQNLYKFKDAI
jgi:hypothetical protein